MKSAVLVIDVQSKIFDSDPKPFEADMVIARINEVTRKARATGMPVFLIQHEVSNYLEFGSEAWQLQKNLYVEDNDIRIRKSTGDAFLRTDLEKKLKALYVENLVICGYVSEFCIDNTTRRATGLGYVVQIVGDAHTTHDKDHLSAQQIRHHHNITLSMAPDIRVLSSSEVKFDK